MKENQTTLLIMRQYFLTIFDFIILSDSNSNFNNFIEILSMKFFSMIRLDDCLMCLNISLIALKTSKSF